MTGDARPLLWYRSARRDRIGKSSALHVMRTAEAEVVWDATAPDARLRLVGPAERGRELEVIALDLPHAVVVIHVFPTGLRGWGRP